VLKLILPSQSSLGRPLRWASTYFAFCAILADPFAEYDLNDVIIITCSYAQGWPEAYIYTVHDRIFGGFPAKNTVYTPYVLGSGQS